jgi:hypothetical protein
MNICTHCGQPDDWHSAIDNACSDSDGPHVDAEPEDDVWPDEDDAFISPTGQLGAQTNATYRGKFLGVFDSDEEAVEAIRERMNADGFFPNIWQTSDHGNVSLYQS